MKRTRRVSLALAALMLAACLLAPGAAARTTDFFQDQPHTQLAFSEIEYVRPDTTRFYELLTQIQALCGDGDNAARVEALFDELTGQYVHFYTMYCLADIQVSRNGADRDAAEEQAVCNTTLMVAGDNLYILIQAVLNSPCGQFLREALSAREEEELLGYQAVSEELLALFQQEQALISEYQAASLTDFSALYQGRDWTQLQAEEAYRAKTLNYGAYAAITAGIEARRAQALGEIYLRMVAVRRELAALSGYDSYADYAYEADYKRDYSPEEIGGFQAAVKENIAPLRQQLYALIYDERAPLLAADYTPAELLEMVGPVLPRLSDELAEAWQYMLDHQMYDLEDSPAKLAGAFTIMLPQYGAPYMMAAPCHYLYDFSTLVHEFGHYNAGYWSPVSWESLGFTVDLAEVHSQGLELLFAGCYPEIFWESAQAAETFLMYNMTSAMVEGCLYDELQQFAFSAQELTVERISREYMRLLKEYGLTAADDPREEDDSWTEIPHTFLAPFYYVSYAVSAAGAFEIWSRSLSDYEGAVDQYLAFVSLQYEKGFEDAFAAVGLESPLTQACVARVAEDLERELNIAQRYQALKEAA